MIQQFNAIHAALSEEINDIREKITSSTTNDSRANFLYADGSVVLPYRAENSLQMIGASRAYGHSFTHFNTFINASGSLVDDNGILKVPGANKKLLATYANMMTTSDNIGKFYGMLIMFDEKKLNPLHPIIAAMITAGEIRLPDTFTLVMYPYAARRMVDTTYADSYKVDIVSMLTSIRSSQFLPTVSYRAQNNMVTDTRTLVTEDIGRVNVRFQENGESIRNAVIPVQLTTRGIVYPYYGLIESHGGGGNNYTSRNLYPCLSGNIDTQSEGSGQTCVGDLNNNAFSSLYVLANMNIDSMYFSDVYTDGSIDFISACQSVSAEFLAAAAGLSFDEDENNSEPESESNSAPSEDESSSESTETEDACDVCVS